MYSATRSFCGKLQADSRLIKVLAAPIVDINGQQVSQEVYNEDLRPILPKKTPEAFARLTTRCW